MHHSRLLESFGALRLGLLYSLAVLVGIIRAAR